MRPVFVADTEPRGILLPANQAGAQDGRPPNDPAAEPPRQPSRQGRLLQSDAARRSSAAKNQRSSAARFEPTCRASPLSSRHSRFSTWAFRPTAQPSAKENIAPARSILAAMFRSSMQRSRRAKGDGRPLGRLPEVARHRLRCGTQTVSDEADRRAGRHARQCSRKIVTLGIAVRDFELHVGPDAEHNSVGWQRPNNQAEGTTGGDLPHARVERPALPHGAIGTGCIAVNENGGRD